VTVLGVHTLELRAGADPAAFERLMTGEVFPAAADVPGSINRGGASFIGSQHLLRTDGSGRYLWLVKAGDACCTDCFGHVFGRTFQAAIAPFATRVSSAMYAVSASYDAGPRDDKGRPLGEPVRGQTL
jgi:hypothetical protein